MLKIDAWQLPWTREDVPHALLDINRGCNISCRACYNTAPARNKPLAELEREVDELRARRKLDTLAVCGGEVLLHPELCRIVRMIKDRKINVEIVSNGLLLDGDYAARLGAAGADAIFLHIDEFQRRPDLPLRPQLSDLQALWAQKAAVAVAHGLEAGLSMPVFPDNIPAIRDMLKFVIASPDISYVLVTLGRDMCALAPIRGNIDDGLFGEPAAAAPPADQVTGQQMLDLMREEFNLPPFAYAGSNLDPADARWFSYMVAALAPGADNEPVIYHGMRASNYERVGMKVLAHLGRPYPMHPKHNPFNFRLQILLNALTGGRLTGNVRFLARSLFTDRALSSKRILFQTPAEIGRDGRVVHCRNCPDAVLKNGGLVPVCISDQVR